MSNTPFPAAATTGFGHGKVILLGEHAVVYGQPALAAGIRSGVRATASPGEGSIRVPAWEIDVQPGDESPVVTAAALLMDKLGVAPGTLDFWMEADIPMRAGLGSSAAMAVAMARAVAARTGATDEQVLAAAEAAETVFHKMPSGIDAAAASRGGVGRFDKATGWQPVKLPQPLQLCVGLSGKGHDTAVQIGSVAELCEQAPVARRVIEAMGEVASAGCEATSAGDLPALGRLFNIAHGLLSGLGVSTPELDTLVHTARAAGALGAKLTGAGGGGAVVALAPARAEAVLAAWRGLGRYGFITTIESE